MSKKEVIDAIAEQSGVAKKAVIAVLDALATNATGALNNYGEFNLHGIGKLTTQVRTARTGRNPRTGETVDIAASTTVKFKVSSTLKAAVQ